MIVYEFDGTVKLQMQSYCTKHIKYTGDADAVLYEVPESHDGNV